MEFPDVVYIKLKVAPASFGDFCGRDFSVVKQNRVFQQQVGNTVAGLFTATLDRELLVTAARATTWFILEVVTEETAKFPLVRSLDQREVVFPDVQVFAIGPWRLVPDIGVTTCSPEKRRHRAANSSVRVRKNCRNLGSDFILQRLGFRRGGDDDVVAGDRELEFVDGFGGDRVRQFTAKLWLGWLQSDASVGYESRPRSFRKHRGGSTSR